MKRQPDVTVNGVPLNKLVLPAADARTFVEDIVGETNKTRTGYKVRVECVRIPGAGMRVRLILTKDEQFIRHLDLTTVLCRDLIPIFTEAAKIGGNIEEMSSPDAKETWWKTISVSEFDERLTGLDAKAAQLLISDLKTEITFVQTNFEITKNFRAKDELRWLILKKKHLVAHLKSIPLSVRQPTTNATGISVKTQKRLDRGTYESKLLFYFGREVERRLGRTVSEEMFAVARANISENE